MWAKRATKGDRVQAVLDDQSIVVGTIITDGGNIVYLEIEEAPAWGHKQPGDRWAVHRRYILEQRP